MKINNRGFAFSTMLYGVLSIIVLVLMLVFGMMQYYKNENDYYSSEIELTLNECVFEEVALENCYSANATCDPTSYYACMGINGNDLAKGYLASVVLKEKVVTLGDGLYVDKVEPKRYVFSGENVNNYIRYANRDWRIVAIEADGSLKVVFPGFTDKLSWDVLGNDEWSSCSLNNYLANTFYTTLPDTSGFVRRSWYTGRLYNTGLLDTVDVIEQERLAEYSGETEYAGMIGLLSASDYVRASLNENCRSDVMSTTSCSSWLSKYESWLISSDGDENDATKYKAYYFGANNNYLSTGLVKDELSVLPTAYLKRTITIIGGNGTSSDPYIAG